MYINKSVASKFYKSIFLDIVMGLIESCFRDLLNRPSAFFKSSKFQIILKLNIHFYFVPKVNSKYLYITNVIFVRQFL
jgi:hypothetical protein